MLMSDHQSAEMKPRRRSLARLALLGSVLLAGAAGPGIAADKAAVGGEFARKGVVTETVGPNGAKGESASVLTLTDQEVKQLRAGQHTAALLFQTSSDWANAVTAGAQDEFDRLGIKVVGLSNSNYSASDQGTRSRRSWPRSRPRS
jgi:hypothetical protein